MEGYSMKDYTQVEFDGFEKDSYGIKQCPSGDYTQIKNFSERCRFGEGCSFGERCSFGTWCRFGEGCRFAFFPVSILRADLGILSNGLTNELMHRDQESHPKPEMFDDWLTGGECPYSVPCERMHSFKQDREAWETGEWKRMADRDLIRAIAKEKNWTIKNF